MIEDYSFGSMTISGKSYRSDLKIIAGKVLPDWWRISGHRVVLSDVEDILQARPDILVIGSGASGLMRVSESLQRHLTEIGVALVVEPTAEAILTFNRLVGEGKKVAAGFHLTC